MSTQELSKEEAARMRKIHSKFINKTNADPALAQDLLDATNWNLEAALEAYKGLSVTYIEQPETQQQYEDIDDSAISGLLGRPERSSNPPTVSELGVDDITKRPKRKKSKAKGLGHAADEVEDMFIKVAVSESKLEAGAEKKEKVFDERFFCHSFLYPDLSQQPDDLKEFVEVDIIERSHKHILTKAGRLNWWATTGKLPVLEPLATTGDGNCLLHAASLYMWGLPDSHLILRTHLHRVLTIGIEKDGIKRRWRHLTNLRNQDAGGLVFSEEEWDFEWSEIIRIATNQPRRRPTTDTLRRYSTLRTHYESLEEIHVFAMAQVLQRPIIVVADEYVRDMNGEPFAPIYFGGIYLPLECSPTSCYKSPMILAFDSSHFSPLVAKRNPVVPDSRRPASRHDPVMPLVTPDGSLLPLPFIYDPEKKNISEKWATEKCQIGDFPDEVRTVLESYLDIRWVQLNIGSKFKNPQPPSKDEVEFQGKVPKFRFPVAVVSALDEHEYQSVLVAKYLENAQERFKVEKVKREKLAAEKAKQEEELRRIQMNRPIPCKGKDCPMYGTAASDGLCSRCYSMMQKNAKQSESVPINAPSNQPKTSVNGKNPPAVSRADSSSSRDGMSPKHAQSSGKQNKMVSFPGDWDIVMPDVIAEGSSLDRGQTDITASDNGIQLISQRPQQEDIDLVDMVESNAGSQIPANTSPQNEFKKKSAAVEPSSMSPKVPSKSSPKAPPPRSPPKSPPEPPPRIVSEKSSNIAPPRSPPKNPPNPPPKTISEMSSKSSNAKVPSRSPPSSPSKPPPKDSKPDVKRPPPPSQAPPTRSTGYSRDKIKPLSSTRNTCSKDGCEFFGSPEYDGMCSGCYKKIHPSITQV